jgi:diguanylate cyclase (GGDEF)-like protein
MMRYKSYAKLGKNVTIVIDRLKHCLHRLKSGDSRSQSILAILGLPRHLIALALKGNDLTSGPNDPEYDDFQSKPVTEPLQIDFAQRLLSPVTHSGRRMIVNSANSGSESSLIADTPVSSETRPSILVVDDESLYLELITDILGDDYQVLVASEGTTGLEIAASNVPQLVLLDLMMPGIDGFEVHRCLKADQRTCEIPTIFVTGRNDIAAEIKGLKMGAVDYITKPLNPELVRARVNTHVNFKLMRDKLALLAATDGLTGLANRSHFDSMLAYEYARHLRSGKELSLVILDIDHFKAFNDIYGHVRGDECLREIARAMTRTVSRATDLLARYGGEEFTVLLPETHLKGAVILAEKVRECISDLALTHSHSSTGYVTASLGVACGRFLEGSSILDVVHEADMQFYAAKARGRNRVSFSAIRTLGLTN